MATDDVKVSIRIPGDLAKWADDQPGTRTEVFVRALTALKDGAFANDDAATLVAQAEAKVASLTTERDQWRDRAKAIVAATPTSNAEGRRLARGRDPMGRSEHAAGPVQSSAVPEVAGTVGWCGLKATKPGR